MPCDTFAYLCMLMGVCNSPAFFNAMMDQLLENELFIACFIYTDNVVVFKHMHLELIQHTKCVL